MRCVRPKSSRLAAPVLFVLLAAALLPCIASAASQRLIVYISLNQEPKGEFFVIMSGGGDFLVRQADLKSMGLQHITGAVTQQGNEKYVSLKSIKGVKFHFDENTLTLELTATPSLLPEHEKNFTPARHTKVVYPVNNSVFLNYALDYNSGSNFRSTGITLGNELGARLSNFLLLSSSTYSRAPSADSFTRLQSSLIHDNRETLQRFTAGDFFAASGELGSALNMGGLSFAKVYQINPYLIKQPMLDVTTDLLTRSDVEVYIDGVLVGKQSFAPGLADLRDINYAGGLHQVDILIKDAFGRERWIHYPFYFTDTLLRKGFHEYSYNVGYLRDKYGSESNSYGSPVFTAYHNYGVTGGFTAGARAEAGRGVYNIGGQGTYRIGPYGTVFLAASASICNGASGAAGSFRYDFQKRNLNGGLSLQAFSPGYEIISYTLSPDLARPEYTASAAAGYGTPKLGNLSAVYSISDQYGGSRIRILTASFQRNITSKVNLTATYKNTAGQPNESEIVFNLTYYFGKTSNVSAILDLGRHTGSEGLQVQKNLPLGEGYGYRAVLERDSAGGVNSYQVDPSVQVNLPGIALSGEYSGSFSGSSGTGSLDLRAAGAIAYVGDSFGFARPISDSFGLVKVGNINGVEVSVNNQYLGKTNKNGEVFVPTLSSYTDNEVSISQKDIPLNYTLSASSEYVSPALRAGALINFEAKRFTAVSGYLKIKYNGQVQPVEYREVTMQVNKKAVSFPTGKGGEFYLEDIQPGRYSASFEYLKKRCVFEIIVPVSKELINDLGNVVCEDIH
ncbi:MAG: fimbria/pilus outer membrane usher protein [Actinomycetota bacterium]|nr:fimbria/pilus outer membrane usher protein [Actinomycetota bacterium]